MKSERTRHFWIELILFPFRPHAEGKSLLLTPLAAFYWPGSKGELERKNREHGVTCLHIYFLIIVQEPQPAV